MVGSVGLPRRKAREAAYDLAVATQQLADLAETRAIDETVELVGLVGLVIDATTDRILGGHIAGFDAGNLVHEVVIAMACGADRWNT